MRLMLSALACPKGDVVGNLGIHLTKLGSAAAQGCQVVVFPEMSLTGSVQPQTRPDRLIDVGDAAVAAVVAATGATGVAASFGIAERSAADALPTSPSWWHRAVGWSATTASGTSATMRTGSHPAQTAAASQSPGVGSAWRSAPRREWTSPSMRRQRPAPIWCCSAPHPGLYGRRTDDDGFAAGLAWWQSSGLTDLRRHARRTGCWIAVATQAGSTEDEEFPGLAALVDPTGAVVDRLPDWRAGDLVVEVPD